MIQIHELKNKSNDIIQLLTNIINVEQLLYK
jgi:hypothetical protein